MDWAADISARYIHGAYRLGFAVLMEKPKKHNPLKKWTFLFISIHSVIEIKPPIRTYDALSQSLLTMHTRSPEDYQDHKDT